MRSGPVPIPNVAGLVMVDSNFWSGKQVVTVDGVPMPSGGRKRFTLPAADGSTVEARVSSSLVNPFPKVEIAGVKHPTGPELPAVLKVMIVLPLMLIVGGLVGGLIGAMGMLANARIAVWDKGAPVKAFAMVGVLLATLIVWLLVVDAIIGNSTS